MRHLTFIILISILLASCGGSRHINQVYHDFNRFDEGVTKFRVPGWLIWLGSGIVHEGTKDQDLKSALQIVKKIKGIRFMVVEKENAISKGQVNGLINNLRQSSYEDLFYIKDGNSTVSFMIREKNEKVKNLLIVVSEPDNFVLTHIKTKIKYSDLSKLIKKYQKEMKIEKAIQRLPQA